MRSHQDLTIDRDAASRALIDLIADLAWSERQKTAAVAVQRTREEAIGLLPKVALGDRAAVRRAMELVGAARGRAA